MGLVLSGGGARGAYEVGVVRRLADENVEIAAVAGTSIGAMNGAVVAAAPTLAEAARRLELIWLEVADRARRMDAAAHIKAAMAALRLMFCFAPGQKFELAKALGELAQTGHKACWAIARHNANNPDDTWLSSVLGLDPAVFDSDRLAALFAGQVGEEELEAGRPFFVSVLPSEGALFDFATAMRGSLGLAAARETVSFHVQSLPVHERTSAVLASAALPFIFESQAIGGQAYVDGGLTGWRDILGNTPLKPLHDSGLCHAALVVHLSEGSLFDRSRFPNLAVVEIRPRSTTLRQGGIRDLLSFDGASLESWIDQGYSDCGYYIDQLREFSEMRSARFEADARLDAAMDRMSALVSKGDRSNKTS